MTLVIGIDEAGYGPNLGPLVVGGTLWRVGGAAATAAADGDARDPLADLAASLAARRPRGGPLWGDSKKIFARSRGERTALAALEQGVLAALTIATGRLPSTGVDMLAAADLALPADASDGCWRSLGPRPIPEAATVEACHEAAAVAAACLADHDVELLAVGCRWIFPAAFNADLDRGDNKSDILSRTSLRLAADLRSRDAASSASIWCDRHGGRKRYAGVVSHCFDAARVEPLAESADCSRYLIHGDGPATSVSFSVGGEAQLPVAVASMTAKYLRELAMAAFNRFWSDHCRPLRPTAGYPLDARRWWRETAAARKQLAIVDQALWRRS